MVLLFTIHALNYVSALLQVIMGIFVLKRNPGNHISQLLAGTFFSLAGYEFFDGFLITVQLDFPGWLDAIRDLALISLIISALLAFSAIILVVYGEKVVYNRTYVIIGILIAIILLYFGVLGDHIIASGPNKKNGFHLDIARSLMGWLAITGSLIILTVVTVLILLKQIKNTKGKLKLKITYFVFGYTLIILNILIFDLAVFVELLNSIIANNTAVHVMIHFLLGSGEILVVSTFLSPLSKNLSYPSLNVTNLPKEVKEI